MEALVGLTEIGRILGVSRQRAAQLAIEHEDFPQPAAVVSFRRIWSEVAVREWAERHPDRRPGRPSQSTGATACPEREPDKRQGPKGTST